MLAELEDAVLEQCKQEAVAALIDAVNEGEEAGWTYQGTENAVRIYQKKRGAAGGACFKGVAVINAPALHVLDLLMHTEHKSEYDEIFEGFELVERVDAVTNVERHWYWTPSKRLVKPRDLCILGHACRVRNRADEVCFNHADYNGEDVDDDEDDADVDDGDGNDSSSSGNSSRVRLAPFSLALVGRSITHSHCMPRNDFVRAHVATGGFVIQPMASARASRMWSELSDEHDDDAATNPFDDGDDGDDEHIAAVRSSTAPSRRAAPPPIPTRPAFLAPTWLTAPRSLVTFVAESDLRGSLPTALSTQLLRKQPQILHHINKMMTRGRRTGGARALQTFDRSLGGDDDGNAEEEDDGDIGDVLHAKPQGARGSTAATATATTTNRNGYSVPSRDRTMTLWSSLPYRREAVLLDPHRELRHFFPSHA